MGMVAVNFIKTNGAYDGTEIEISNSLDTEDGVLEICNAILNMKNRYNIESVCEIIDLDE